MRFDDSQSGRKPRLVYIEFDDGVILRGEIQNCEASWDGPRSNYDVMDFRYGACREPGNFMELRMRVLVDYTEVVDWSPQSQSERAAAILTGQRKAEEQRKRAPRPKGVARRFGDLTAEEKKDENPRR